MAKILEHATAGEAMVTRALVNEILHRGYKIKVYDGEEWVTKPTADRKVILEALCSTGEDRIFVCSPEDNSFCCCFLLIWGNASDGSELLADWTDNGLANNFVKNIKYILKGVDNFIDID